MKKQISGHLVLVGLSLAFLQLLGCAQPKEVSNPVKAAAGTEVVIKASFKSKVSKRNGQIIVELLEPTGIKELDELNIQFLKDTNDGFKNLKEGETITAEIDPEIVKELVKPR